MFQPSFRRCSALTILEIAMVIVILGILVAIVVPKWVDMQQQAKTASENYVISSIQEALATYNAAQYLRP